MRESAFSRVQMKQRSHLAALDLRLALTWAGSIAIADIYGENNPGTAVANGDSNNVVILLNTGNGTSLSQITMATGPGSNYVEIADVNSDDKAGIITTNHEYTIDRINLHV